MMQSEFLSNLDFVESLFGTPNEKEERVPRCFQTPVQIQSDDLDDLFEVLQDLTSTQPTYLSPSSDKPLAKPHLDIDLLDDVILKDLDWIATELYNLNSTRKGQKVRKRLFSGSDDEPTPKKQRKQSSDSDSDDNSEFVWTSSGRRS